MLVFGGKNLTSILPNIDWVKIHHDRIQSCCIISFLVGFKSFPGNLTPQVSETQRLTWRAEVFLS